MTDRLEQVIDEVNEGPVQMKHYVVFLLDRSTSMKSIREEALDCINHQVEQTKSGLEGQDHIKTEVSLVTFSSKVDQPELWCRPLQEIDPIPLEDYEPFGMTAMYDAVGYVIQRLQQQPDINDKNTSVLMFIMSDGVENNSKNFGASHISAMVREMQATGRWTFVYEGANQDLAEVQDATNINAGNTIRWTADAAGLRQMTITKDVASQQYYDHLVNASNTGGGAVASTGFYTGTAGSSDGIQDSHSGELRGTSFKWDSERQTDSKRLK